MTKNIKITFTQIKPIGNTPAKLRKEYMNKYFIPLCKSMFNKDKYINSIVFNVAQYWNDEADDAVHASILCSEEKKPDLDKLLSSYYDTYDNNYSFIRGAHEDAFGTTYTILDDNDMMIWAFAGYCKEGKSQNDDYHEQYATYALATRDENNEVKIDIIGKVLRPAWDEYAEIELKGRNLKNLLL